jgi:hypothetical protein
MLSVKKYFGLIKFKKNTLGPTIRIWKCDAILIKYQEFTK